MEILSDPDLAMLDPDDIDAFNFIDMVASSPDNLANINVGITHLSIIESHLLTEELIAYNTLKQLPELEKLGISNCAGETEIRNLFGGQHSVVHIEGAVGGIMQYQTLVIIMEGCNYGVITVTSFNEDVTDDILEWFFKTDLDEREYTLLDGRMSLRISENDYNVFQQDSTNNQLLLS